MKLYFEKDGYKKLIAEVDTQRQAIWEINNFCQKRNFVIYYMRSWTEDNVKKYDVGSHTEFFELELV